MIKKFFEFSKLITFLFYIPKDNKLSDFGTSLYKSKNREHIENDKHLSEEETSLYFEKIKTCNFLPNSLLVFPRTNIPNYINSIDEYLDIIQKFKLTNSITKSRQIWWKIRPHINYGTIEFRMCDAQRSLKNIHAFISIFQS